MDGKLNIRIQIHQQISQTFHSAAPHGLVVVTCASSSPSRITLKGRKALKGLSLRWSSHVATDLSPSWIVRMFLFSKKQHLSKCMFLHIQGECACVVTICSESKTSTRFYKALISLVPHPNSGPKLPLILVGNPWVSWATQWLAWLLAISQKHPQRKTCLCTCQSENTMAKEIMCKYSQYRYTMTSYDTYIIIYIYISIWINIHHMNI